MRPVLEMIERVGPVRRERADHRRERNGKGPRRARPARRLATRVPAARDAERRRDLRRRLRERALRARQGRVHRRARRPRRAASSSPTAARSSSTRSPTCPASQQAKLLRVLETGEFERLGSSRTRKVDVRILSATNADPHAEVAAGTLPPGPALPAQHDRDPRSRRCASGGRTFRCSPSTSCGATPGATARTSPGFEPAALQALLDHSWPGNVRELDHAVERAALMAPGARVRPADLGLRTPPTAGRRRSRR